MELARPAQRRRLSVEAVVIPPRPRPKPRRALPAAVAKPQIFAWLPSPHRSLVALAPILIASGLANDADALFELDQAGLEAILIGLGSSVVPLARILCLHYVAAERTRRAALLL